MYIKIKDLKLKCLKKNMQQQRYTRQKTAQMLFYLYKLELWEDLLKSISITFFAFSGGAYFGKLAGSDMEIPIALIWGAIAFYLTHPRNLKEKFERFLKTYKFEKS